MESLVFTKKLHQRLFLFGYQLSHFREVGGSDLRWNSGVPVVDGCVLLQQGWVVLPRQLEEVVHGPSLNSLDPQQLEADLGFLDTPHTLEGRVLLQSQQLPEVEVVVGLVEQVLPEHLVDSVEVHGGHVEHPDVAALGAPLAPGLLEVAGVGQVDDRLLVGSHQDDPDVVETLEDAVVGHVRDQLLLDVVPQQELGLGRLAPLVVDVLPVPYQVALVRALLMTQDEIGVALEQTKYQGGEDATGSFSRQQLLDWVVAD